MELELLLSNAGDLSKLPASLRKYVDEDGPLGPALQHPMAQQVCGIMPAHAAALVRQQRRRRGEALRARDWAGYAFAHERPWRAEALANLTHVVAFTDEDFQRACVDVWTDTENAWQVLPFWKRCARLQNGFVWAHGDGGEDSVRRLRELRDQKTVRVYRGHQWHNGDGLAWTLHRSTAEWFAKRWRREGEAAIVTTGEVRGRDVFTYLSGRSEEEVIVRPRLVKNKIDREV